MVDLACGRHLARHEAVPDDAVDAQLRARQIGGHGVRRPRHIGRADGLVGFLRALAAAVDVRFFRNVFRPVVRGDVFTGLCLRFLRDVHGVRSHIGDKTDGAAAEFNTFIQLLRNAHRLARAQLQGAAAGLLQRTRNERRRSGLTARRLRHFRHTMGHARAFQRIRKHVRLTRVRDNGFFIVQTEQTRANLRAVKIRAGEQRVEIPVFLRLEGLNLAFAFHDETKRDGLNAPRARPFLDAAPQQRAHLITDETVQHTTGLLRGDQIHRDLAGLLEGTLNRVPRDFVERDTMELAMAGRPQDFLQMPRDRLPFAVRVCRQIDLVRRRCRLPQ